LDGSKLLLLGFEGQIQDTGHSRTAVGLSPNLDLGASNEHSTTKRLVSKSSRYYLIDGLDRPFSLAKRETMTSTTMLEMGYRQANLNWIRCPVVPTRRVGTDGTANVVNKSTSLVPLCLPSSTIINNAEACYY
jgi:hypothetical protein